MLRTLRVRYHITAQLHSDRAIQVRGEVKEHEVCYLDSH